MCDCQLVAEPLQALLSPINTQAEMRSAQPLVFRTAEFIMQDLQLLGLQALNALSNCNSGAQSTTVSQCLLCAELLPTWDQNDPIRRVLLSWKCFGFQAQGCHGNILKGRVPRPQERLVLSHPYAWGREGLCAVGCIWRGRP